MLIFAAVIFISTVHAQNIETVTESPVVQEENSGIVFTKPDLRHVVISLGETETFNVFLTFYNKVIAGAGYADINLETMKFNLTNPWVWDQDEFDINTFGHPYQGSYYFVAARANGLDFWASLGVAAFGSITWEYLMENETPSYNDLIITTISGAVFGEVLHRVYLLVEDKIPILPLIISPQDAFNRFITGEKSPRVDGNLYSLSVSLGPQFTLSSIKKVLSDENLSLYDKSFGGKASLRLMYEDPFVHKTEAPFDCFDVKCDFMLSPDYYYIYLAGSGNLFSWPLNVDNDMTFAVTLHYDTIMSKEISFSNNSIGASLFNRIGNFSWNGHLTAAFLGGSEFYDNLVIRKRDAADGSEQRLYDLGIGATAKAEIRFEHPVIGTFFAYGFCSYFYTIPHSIPLEGSAGSNFVWYANFGYEHMIYKGLGAGISAFVYNKHGSYESADNVDHRQISISTYVSYHL